VPSSGDFHFLAGSKAIDVTSFFGSGDVLVEDFLHGQSDMTWQRLVSPHPAKVSDVVGNDRWVEGAIGAPRMRSEVIPITAALNTGTPGCRPKPGLGTEVFRFFSPPRLADFLRPCLRLWQCGTP